MARLDLNDDRPHVDWKLMNDFMIDVFAAYGVPRDEAAICADVLLEADRRGIESHGCNRFKPIYIDRFENGTLLPKTEIEVLKETPTTVVMDAHDGMGMVASYHMMKKLIEKAKTYGGQIMCDLSAPANHVAKRTAEVDELGVDYIAVHTGYLPEYDYDLETHRFFGFAPKVRPLDVAKIAKRNMRKAGLCLNTGINETNIRDVLALKPEIIMVGRAILDSDDKVAAAERIKRFMPFEG